MCVCVCVLREAVNESGRERERERERELSRCVLLMNNLNEEEPCLGALNRRVSYIFNEYYFMKIDMSVGEYHNFWGA